MGKFKDVTGQKFGRLTVIRQGDYKYCSGKPVVCWECQCDCGNTSLVAGNALRTGQIKSCGCLLEERKWSAEEVELLKKMVGENRSASEMVNVLGKTKGAIQSKMAKLGIQTDSKYNINNKKIYQNYDWCYKNYIVQGHTMQEMADMCGVTLRVIEKWCREKFGLSNRTAKDFIELNDEQKQLIMFSLLGDGHIVKRENTPLFIVSHAENQKDYLFWKYSILKNLCNKKPSYVEAKIKPFNEKEYLSQPAYRLGTKVINALRPIKQMTKKEIVQELNEFGLSIFMLDDGSCDRAKRWEICVADFDDETKQTFIDVLKERFEIEGKLEKDVRYIRFNKENSAKISDIILRNIPNDLDVVRHKIINNKQQGGD